MDVPGELLEQICNDNIALFCGAGISISPDGLPGGAQLASELAIRAHLGDITCMPLPEVAQAYALEMGMQSLIQYLSTRINDISFQPLTTHHLIASLPFQRIITTNWDNLLEDALRQGQVPFNRVVRDHEIAYTHANKKTLIKLHGSIEQPDTIIITGDDYYDIFARLPETTNLVRSYFATKTLLFIGFSLADEDFRRLYHEVVRHLGRHVRRAYAVQLSPSPFAVKYWQQRNVEVIDAQAEAFLTAVASLL